MAEEDANKLEAALTPLVHNGQEQVDDGGEDDDSDCDRICIFVQGWEETTDAALTFLLRTSLAKVLLIPNHIFCQKTAQ